MKRTLHSLRFAFTLFAIAISSSFSNAQEQCLSRILHDRLMSTDSTYAATMMANENVLQGIIADIESGARLLPTSYRVPLVVHIIHKGEAIGVGTNISDAQIYSAIRTLNEAYRKKSGTEFFGNGMDTGLEFCLAQKDAAGNPSTGILRVNGSGTSDYATNGLTTSGSNNETTIKNLSKWNNTKYYNIWVVAEIDGNNGGAGVQGFAYFPGASATYDGAVMLYNCFGYDPTGVFGYNLKSYTNRNKTLIHEMGHALNLYHTFEGDGTGATCPTNTNCNTQGDRCCDVPPHMRSNSTCIADGTANTCLAGTYASDYQHNYMDYSADVCTNMFTANQSTRMNATLATGGPRASLSTATNLTNCGCSIPIVLFSANPVNPCLGIPVQFTDESLNFPTSWLWSFPGGATPPSATAQNPTATYSAAGAYNVTLQATTAAGNTGTLTKTAYINPIASAALPFSENFEGATFPPTGWTRVSGDAPSVAWGTDGIHQWERRPAVGNTGSTAGSAAMNLFNYNLVGPPIDNLIVKPVSLVGMSTSQMTFKVSHKNYPSASNYDSLKVFVSTDCGQTFGAAVYSKSGTTLATNGALSTTFTPAVAADWRTETVNLNSYIGQIIIVKFVTYSNYGNNVYIDDVNITGSSSGPVASVVITSSDADNTFCAGTSVTFTATPTNGGTTPTYQWQINGVNVGGATSSTFNTNALTNGQIVTCIMTSNLFGVVGSPATSNAITNTVNAIPSTPTPSSNTPVCVGGSIVLSTATVSGATYAWTGPSGYTSGVQNPTRSAATVVMSGTYNVTVTVNGCTSPMGSTIVAVNNVPTTPAVITNSPVCAGANINLSTSAVSGATYNWTGPSGYTNNVQNPTLTGATATMAGTYSLTITVGGCNSPAGTGVVVVNPSPSAPSPGSNTPVCSGTTINLTTATVVGATYAWTGPASFTSATQNPTRSGATAAMAGTYSLTVTVSGCTSPVGTTTVVVNTTPSTPAAGSNTPVCTGSAINLTSNTVAGATYSWTGPSSFTSALEDPTIAVATAGMAGTYSVTITSGGCTSPVGTTAVVVNTTPGPITAGNNGPICASSTLNLTCTTAPGSTYAWSGPSGYTSAVQNPTRTGATVAMSGTYTVTATASGCSATSTTVATITAAPTTPTAGSNTPVCTGTTINLTTPTVAGATYAWTGPASFTSTSQNPSRSGATAAMAGTYSVTVTVGGCTSAVGTTVVAVNTTPATPAPMINGSATPAAICVGGTITLTTATVTGATYAWTGPNSYSVAVRNPPALTGVTTAMGGTYSLTVTVGGCTSIAGTASITVNPIPATPTAGSNSPVCTGSTINLTTPTVAGATYAWTGPAAFSSALQNPTRSGATAGMAGTYSVTITVGGCASAAGTTAVTVNSSVTPANSIALTTGSNPTCAGSSLTFTATGSGGGGSPIYQWQINGSNEGTGGTTYTTSSLTNGQVVTCILTSSSTCASPTTATSNAITMTVNAIPATPTAGSNTPVCSGNTIDLTTATVAGASYSWTGPNTFTSTSQNPSTAASTAVMSGTYSVTITVAGCTSASGTTSAVVNTSVTPTISTSATPSGTICSGTNVNFTAAETDGGASPTYQWQVNGSNAGTGATYNSSALVNGDIVTCILTSNATCASPVSVTSAGITMSVNSSVVPSVSVSIGAGTNPMCSGQSITFIATPTNGGATPGYQWQVNGANTSTLGMHTSSTLNNGDVVTCILTSSSACASPTTITSSGLTMVVDPITTPAVSISVSNTIICTGDSVVFNAIPTNGGTSPAYQWQVNGSNTGSGASYTNYGLADTDVVTCILTTSDPCPTTATANSNNLTITVNPIPATPTISQSGLTLTSSAATGNQWYLDGVIIPGATSQDYTALSNGNYTVVVTENGCTSVESAPTAIINVGIDEAVNSHLLSVYPNPNDGNFMVSFLSNEKDSYTIELTNALGQSVYKEEMKDFTGKYSKQLSVETFGKGIYMINLTNSNHETVKKIVVY